MQGEQKKKKHIYAKLSRIYLFSMLIPVMVLAMVLSIYFYRLIQKENARMSQSILDTIELNLSTCFSRMNHCSLAWVANEDIFNFYKKVNSNEGAVPQEPLSLTDRYIASCNSILSLSGKEVKGIAFYPLKNRESILYYHKKYNGNLLLTISYPIEEEEWFQRLSQSSERLVYCAPHIPSYENGEDCQVISIARKIRNVDTKRDIGIIKVDADVSHIQDAFANVQTSPNSGYMILDEQKNIVYSTNQELNELAVLWEIDLPILDAPETGNYYVYSKPISNLPWTLVYFGASRDILAQTNVIFYVAALLGIVALMGAFLLFKVNSSHLTRPVGNILRTMEKNETGDLTTKIEVVQGEEDEFALISRHYNHMIDMLNLYIEREYKAQLEQQKAEFFALQMQINPHFLYNTLNGVIALNRMGESKLLEKTIIQLTQLFRYTCSNEHTVRIREEMEFAERYLFLQSLRFDDKLEYHIHCQQEVEDRMIPKLIIQPLVENAIIHGLEPLDRLVHVQVNACLECRDEKQIICITVEDDGCGTDVKDFEQASHVGINNLKRRISALLPGGTFLFESAGGKGTRCVIEFLCEMQE